MGKPVEKKKKKGRPSLLDLQKRSLRLQQQQEQQKNTNPNRSPNPYARFPNPPAGRRHTRRNPNPEPEPPLAAEDEGAGDDAVYEEDEDDDPNERRKEKKLKLVLHLPHQNANSSDLAGSSESDCSAPKKRKIDSVEKVKSKTFSSKGTESPQGKTSDLGPTTPLPDKKLLEFILDRLQKKDTYGVYSEPVDSDELPDYLDIIVHPMDFGTVRKKLTRGAYKSLEQFEKDVFLISSNAMRYNSPGTIYFRQARSIHELAKKSFDNLRQESDDNEPEPKIVRRGRPPGTGKNSIKRPVGRPPAELTRSEFSSETSLANAVNCSLSSTLRNDLLRKVSGLEKHGKPDVSAKASQFICSSEAYNIASEQKSERNEDYSGSKGFSKYGKKLSEVDENRRNTYKQDQVSSSLLELLMLSGLDAERKFLVPIGLHVEYAYARSLARFAGNLGPIGWEIAAKRIEKVLPPGTKFGPGWVGESEAPQPSHSKISTVSRGEELPDPDLSTSMPHDNSRDCCEAKASYQIKQNTIRQPPANGFKVAFGPPSLPRPVKLATTDAASGKFCSESAATAHAFANNTVSGISLNHRWTATSGSVANEGAPSPSSREGQRPAWNARFQSSGSSIPGVAADSQAQKPDLALQL